MSKQSRLLFALLVTLISASHLEAGTVSTSYGLSIQVNVDANGNNIPGDAANEPSMCLNPLNPLQMAVGWRQFDTTNSDFRQSGWAYSTNGGLNWTFPGRVDSGTFRSDPVLAANANGTFFFLGITNDTNFACDLVRSTNSGATWERVGPAIGGDKEWMTIDTTFSAGRGNIYQIWSPFYNSLNNPNNLFTRSTDGGVTWLNPIPIPHLPYFGTVDVGPNGEVYVFGTGYDVQPFVVCRSTNAQFRLQTPVFDLNVQVDLGGSMEFGIPGLNQDGLLGQAWLAVDRSSGPTRGNVYVLCSVANNSQSICNVMFSRSTNGGVSWSPPVRINDDPATQYAAHWFGTLAVAPNGRVDACWNDTRNSPDNTQSELFYSWSDDGGVTWAPNRRVSPQFNQSVGYPQQEKMGDYIAMTSLNDGPRIAYTATFNGEEDIYFVRPELPIRAQVSNLGSSVQIQWNSVPGVSYCVQAKPSLALPWSAATNVACLVAASSTTTVLDVATQTQEYYRVVRNP